MGYSKEVYERAQKILNDRRAAKLAQAEERRQEVWRQIPRTRDIQTQLSQTAVAAARAVLKGGGARQRLEQLRQSNQALQQELAGLLRQAGLPEDYLDTHCDCPLCQDEGFVDGRPCACLKALMRTEACRRLNAQTPLALSTFESFDLRYYPDTPTEQGISVRQHMKQVYEYCKRYAESFTPHSPSLLFRGGTGLSKTHLSLAIANVVLRKGYGVLYDSVHAIMNRLERERFGRNSDREDTSRLMTECDLLILDDLGTEFSTSFVTASIYHLVNARLMAQKPTLISTNLTMPELEKRYGERLVSRVIGNYVHLPFYGKDIRQQKSAERYQNAEKK